MKCGPLKQHLKLALVSYLKELFDTTSNDSFFLAISKTSPWLNEPRKDELSDSVKSDTDFWREMIALKRIRSGDVSLMIPRINWVVGSVYDAYSDDIDLYVESSPKQFYVLVDEDRVYKCIDNNNGARSTQKPIETTSNIFKTSDGYKWKFMYKITPTTRKFLTDDFMPVEFVTAISSSNDAKQSQFDVQNAAIDRGIEFIRITQIGDAFTKSIPANSSNLISGFTTGTSGSSFGYNLTSNNISLIDGHYLNYSLKITDPTSSSFGEVKKIISYDGDAKRAFISENFSGASSSVVGKTFSIIPTVQIIGDGSGAEAEAKIDASTLKLTSIEMISTGNNYTYATVTILPTPDTSTQNQGSTGGIESTAVAVMSPMGGHGNNPVREFGSQYVGVVVNLEQEEGGKISGEHDFRQFGIVKNPLMRTSNKIAGQQEDVLSSYLVQKSTFINDFVGLTAGDKYIIGVSSGHVGTFESYTTTIGNTLTGTLVVKNLNHAYIIGEKLIVCDTDYTDGTSTQVSIGRFLSESLRNNQEVYRQTYKLDVFNNTVSLTDTTFIEDTVVVGSSSGARGTVSAWYRDFAGSSYSTSDGTLELVDVQNGNFLSGEGIKLFGATSSVVKASINTVTAPELKHRSGDVLYLENIQVLERDDEQKEEIIIILGV